MTTSGSEHSRRGPVSISEEQVSSKMQKTNVTPPERLMRRRQTAKDDLRVKYSCENKDKVGNNGKRIPMKANMFQITVNPDAQIYMYSAVFSPEIFGRGLKDYLISQCNFDQFHYNLNCIFFPHKNEEEFTKVVKKRDGTEVTITFKLKNQINPNSHEMNSMIGSLTKRCNEQMSMVPINRGLYLLENKVEIANYPYNVISGYNTAVLPHENELLMTINLSNKLMSSNNASAHMVSLMKQGNGKDFLLSQMIGRTVLTVYNNKTYRIDDIDFDLNPRSTFEQRQPDGTKKMISYADYFEQNYKLKIKDLKQPLFISRPKKVDRRQGAEEPKNISLIPETCVVCGIEEKYKIDFNFKKAMDRAIIKDPAGRQRAVQKFMSEFKKGSAYKTFSKWGFDLKERSVDIPARVLPELNIVFGDNKQVPSSKPFTFRDLRLYDASQPIQNWVILAFDNKVANDLSNNLIKVCRPLGMQLGRPRVQTYRDSNQVRDILDSLRSTPHPIHMIVMILKTPDKSLYDLFKKETCLRMGIPSQCLLAKHFHNVKGVLSVVTKIAVQMQVKVGGTAWTCHFPAPQTFMFVGMDTYHDSSVKGMSCVATVATLNNSFTKYAWQTSMVQARQETNTVVRSQFEHLITRFSEANGGTVPQRIVIYRDGVGEGQVQHIMEHEFASMQQVISERCPGTQVAFLTISKRIEARFYGDRGNPPPGTVIDQVATHAGQRDFYLVPLSSNQGTVAPIHYRIHYDSTTLKADNHQALSNWLGRLYSNWTGPIKVPMVCQSAHKLAYLVGTHLHQNPSSELDTKLFFL